jgi:hypothetical protein
MDKKIQEHIRSLSNADLIQYINAPPGTYLPEAPSIQQIRRLRMLELVIASSERPTAVVGHSPSGKSRLRSISKNG